MTLNTFHSAGVATKNVTLGIPRLKELLDGTRNPKTPCVTIRLLPGYRDSELVADYIASTLPLTRLGDLVSGCDIVDLGAADLPRHVRSVLEMEELLTGCTYDGLAMRLELNEELMRKRQLTPPMVRKTLAERTHKRSVVLASEATSLEWFLLIKFLELPDIIEHGGLTTEHESMLIHNVMRVLFDIVGVSGHPKVTSAQSGAAKRMPTREMEPKDERVIHAYGSCLADIVVAPCVDWNRTTSNDVCEVLSVLGIEACAHVLFEQIKSVVSFDGTYVDDRHVAVIVETMTRGGALMSLTRHGFNREATSPLMRCSFEETTDVLYQAALNADCENARCVSTSIMLGQTAHFGTGSVKVMFRRKGGCATQSKPRRRVLRSTRRSFIDGAAAPTAEYVIDNVKPVGPRIGDRSQEPTAPPQRKRPRSSRRRRRAFFLVCVRVRVGQINCRVHKNCRSAFNTSLSVQWRSCARALSEDLHGRGRKAFKKKSCTPPQDARPRRNSAPARAPRSRRRAWPNVDRLGGAAGVHEDGGKHHGRLVGGHPHVHVPPEDEGLGKGQVARQGVRDSSVSGVEEQDVVLGDVQLHQDAELDEHGGDRRRPRHPDGPERVEKGVRV